VPDDGIFPRRIEQLHGDADTVHIFARAQNTAAIVAKDSLAHADADNALTGKRNHDLIAILHGKDGGEASHILGLLKLFHGWFSPFL
jgi:hypothetical protein